DHSERHLMNIGPHAHGDCEPARPVGVEQAAYVEMGDQVTVHHEQWVPCSQHRAWEQPKRPGGPERPFGVFSQVVDPATELLAGTEMRLDALGEVVRGEVHGADAGTYEVQDDALEDRSA